MAVVTLLSCGPAYTLAAGTVYALPSGTVFIQGSTILQTAPLVAGTYEDLVGSETTGVFTSAKFVKAAAESVVTLQRR